MSTETLFDPARMPARDEDGYVWHPDLDERFQHDEWEEYVDRAKFTAAGFELASVEFEYDADDAMLDRYYENDEHVPEWQPSFPEGDGWQLIAIYDSEDGPQAMFVRPIIRGTC